MNTLLFEKNAQAIYQTISEIWNNSIVPKLTDYIKIPNKSVLFDPNWKVHGYMNEAMTLIVEWCEKQPIKDMKLEVMELPGRTPLLFVEIPSQIDETVLLYGHIDKQPEMKGWDTDLGPWKPVIKSDKLYGRGGADDGYAVFSSITAIAILQRYHIPHARCVVIIEACEESGSVDLPFYLHQLRGRIGSPNFVICLDSGCGNYEQLWCTNSLRGLIGGKLKIDVLETGLHSGTGSGVIPSPFLILRQLLNRIEEVKTGTVIVNALKANIPDQYIEQAQKTSEILGDTFFDMYSLLPHVKTVSPTINELLLNRTWRPQLSITGIDGLPPIKNAGNVSIPNLMVMLSLRLPPTIDAEKASIVLKKLLEKDPPYNTKITFTSDTKASGWIAPTLSDWLVKANETASQKFFGKPAAYIGEGGSIPFMKMLGKMYPKAQFMITGLLGPQSNAHGPNEFLHIPTGKKLTACVASVLVSHYQHYSIKNR